MAEGLIKVNMLPPMVDAPRLVRAPAAVVLPVPPLATGTVPSEISGVAPPDEAKGDEAVTEVTVPAAGAVQLKEPAVAPAVKTLPLLVVPVAIT
jgi:hypothetical protein